MTSFYARSALSFFEISRKAEINLSKVMLCRLSDLPGLEQAFVEIQKMGLRPDRTTFNILVNAYVDADRHTEVCSWSLLDTLH